MIQRIQEQIGVKFNFFLYFSALTLNLASFTAGIAWAWSSPIIPKLQGIAENPLGHPLTENEISWVASLLPLGSATGPFIGGYLADKIGRKRTLILSMIPTIAAFVTLAFATNIYLYYAARLVLGLTAIGISVTAVSMYIGEVAEIHNRGTLGCFTILHVAFGSVFSFAVGPYISIKWFNLSCTIAPILFLLIFTFFVPETPAYLVMKGKHEEAERSLKQFRRITPKEDFQRELLDIHDMAKKSIASRGGIADILRTKYLFKALCLSMGLMAVQQFTATSIITFYLQFIFESAGSSVSPKVAPIIIGALEVFGALTSAAIVDRLGRKPLLLVSTIATCLALTALSVFFYLLIKIDVSSFTWVPLVTLIFYNLNYGIGIGSLPQAVLSEIFPPHVKSTAAALTVCCCFGFSFATSKIFPILVSAVDNWFGFMVFAVANAIGVIFIYVVFPETKGKTLAQILDSFK